jgi:hypothetical protein
VCYNVFKTFIFSHEIWNNMIQTKTIAMLMIAIATVGAIAAELLVQHANAAPGNGQGAIVQKGVPCWLNAPLTGPPNGEGHAVYTPNGGAQVNCHL